MALQRSMRSLSGAAGVYAHTVPGTFPGRSKTGLCVYE